MARADRIRRPAGWLALLLLVAVPASHSLAKTCTPSGSEASRLQRQIASNMAMARNHACTVGSGGFACREIAGRIAQARAELAALPSACKPVVRTVREEVKPKPKRAVVRKPVKVAAEAATTRAATLCVRLSDGYYFPTPNSGFAATPASTETLAAQCKAICDTADMDVFRHDVGQGDPKDMISLSSGKRYGDLATAGLYRTAAEAKACDMSRLSSTAARPTPAAIAPPTVTEAAAEASPAGEPTVLAALENQPTTGLFMNVSLRGTKTDIPRLPRKVRMVGPAFLPEP
ncbi:DUF2865 domain-containing protein [Rhizobium sp. DKSPLA3]|uniref:DUF2865 domain-containing protein n=1 Tax=Rhizobium quercicola TaxID=2901226 RepID=A0A9X1T1N1_9HYPH|nr:DUF2865 domain-containing protein [Rhizobium quercicola]MCD7109990.1 DUF2865 domain-containing protein [Rhizobium quercicola]